MSTPTAPLPGELVAIILGPKILLKQRGVDKYQT